MNNARQNLIRILQSAYSGEMAAAYAYRGHWKNIKLRRARKGKKQCDKIRKF